MTSSQHVYEVRRRNDRRGVDLISDALPFGRLWYEDASAAVDYARHSSRSHDAVIRVYDEAGNVIETVRAWTKPRKWVLASKVHGDDVFGRQRRTTLI